MLLMKERWPPSCTDHRKIVDTFSARYGVRPVAVARAPGRVNLIGEHIDYEGYGVLPMAMEQACFVAVGWQDQDQQACSVVNATRGVDDGSSNPQLKLVIGNTQHQVYPPGKFHLLPAAPLPDDSPGWIKYIHAAYKGSLEFAASEGQRVPSRGNILMMVHGNIPPGSGLSSSSALVVSVALALLALWDIPATQQQVADFACRCERYVGTEGGGMDQAVSVMAQQGLALHVEFEPVRSNPVPLPAGGVFVVANCLAPSLKAETAASRYNRRVLECRLAAMLLNKRLSEPHPSYTSADDGSSTTSTTLAWRAVRVLQQVEADLLKHAFRAEAEKRQCQEVLSHVAGQLVTTVQQLLPHASYTLQQVCQLLGSSEVELLSLLPAALQQAAAGSGDLQLQQRAVHVFSESQRVLDFKSVCSDASLSHAEKLSQLGSLMDASHASCAELYQCSCKELDTLVKVAKTAGALGARLTGAGWGGCVVALIREKQAADFIATLEKCFYKNKQQQLGGISQFLFKTVPSAGATVWLVQ